MTSKVIVKKSAIDRKGVFAGCDIKKGEVVIPWHPKNIISKEELALLSDNEQHHVDPTGDGRFLVMGEPERFVNHSCEPNTYPKARKTIAIQDIKKGEEITTDYALNGIQDWKMACFCGSKHCRKIIHGDFFKLPKKVQKKYLPCLEGWFKKYGPRRI